MSEEIKYYIPEISDFYIGYEYEYLDIYNNWVARIFTSFGLDTHLFTERFFLENGIEEKKIRVPYLSIDQIIKEGWNTNCNLDNNYINFSHNKKELAALCFTKNDFHLKCPLVLIQNSMVGRVGEVECKSINEFRKICKWLKIN